MFKKKKALWFSQQVDDLWKKLDAGIEIRVKNFLK